MEIKQQNKLGKKEIKKKRQTRKMENITLKNSNLLFLFRITIL